MQRKVRLDALLENNENLPTLPEVLVRLNEVANSPYSSFEDFAQIIEKDTGLTARVLKIVNSAFYGFPRKIERVSRACSLLGTQKILNIVFSTKIIDTFKGVDKKYVDMRAFWEHNLMTGIVAKVLSTMLQEINPESYFASGLLHDIGRLILLKNYPELMKEIFYRHQNENILLWKLEKDVFGKDHANIGGILLKKWKYPLVLQEVVMYHHYPCQSETFKKNCAIIHLSNIIAKSIIPATSGDFFISPLDKDAYNMLNFSQQKIKFIVEKSRDIFSEVVSFFITHEV